MKLGNAKYGAEYTKKKYFKLKDGESVFRILPPMGKLADKGIWSVYHSVHYGYKNTEGKTRTFLSPLVMNRTTRMIESPDAALEFIDKIKAQIEAAKLKGDKATADKLQDFAGGQKSRFNLDKNHYLNVMDLQGNIGVLKIRHRCKLALDATIKSLRAKGVDPLSPTDGRFFVFHRSGNALDTSFQIGVYAETIEIPNIGKVQKEVVHTLTQDIVDRLHSEAVELDDIFRSLTSDEVQRIVSQADPKTGISKAVDEIFGNVVVDNSADEQEDPNQYQPPAVEVKAKVVPAPSPEAEPAPVQAPAQAPAPAYVPPPLAASAPAPTQAKAVAETADLDFLAGLGVKLA